MRILTVDAAWLGTGVADIIEAADPSIAAITSLSPADACSVATRLSWRYAIQCWNVPLAGKAVMWKPVIPLHGLYRAEFRDSNGMPGLDVYGLLRVTLMWDGTPLHVHCAQFADSSQEANWQLVQAARELESVNGAAIVFAFDPGASQLPAWPGLSDAWKTARCRSIGVPPELDLGAAARAAFGVMTPDRAQAKLRLDSGGRSRMRLLCSQHFSAIRAHVGPVPGDLDQRGSLVVDLAPTPDSIESPLEIAIL